MNPSPRPAELGRATSMQYAESNRDIALALAGVCVTLVTFSLFFVSGHNVNALLFQVTVGSILFAIFFFTLAGATFYAVPRLLAAEDAHAAAFDLRGPVLFFAGSLILSLEPALLLFTVGLPGVGIVGVGLWVALLAVLRKNYRVFRLFE